MPPPSPPSSPGAAAPHAPQQHRARTPHHIRRLFGAAPVEHLRDLLEDPFVADLDALIAEGALTESNYTDYLVNAPRYRELLREAVRIGDEIAAVALTPELLDRTIRQTRGGRDGVTMRSVAVFHDRVLELSAQFSRGSHPRYLLAFHTERRVLGRFFVALVQRMRATGQEALVADVSSWLHWRFAQGYPPDSGVETIVAATSIAINLTAENPARSEAIRSSVPDRTDSVAARFDAFDDLPDVRAAQPIERRVKRVRLSVTPRFLASAQERRAEENDYVWVRVDGERQPVFAVSRTLRTVLVSALNVPVDDLYPPDVARRLSHLALDAVYESRARGLPPAGVWRHLPRWVRPHLRAPAWRVVTPSYEHAASETRDQLIDASVLETDDWEEVGAEEERAGAPAQDALLGAPEVPAPQQDVSPPDTSEERPSASTDETSDADAGALASDDASLDTGPHDVWEDIDAAAQEEVPRREAYDWRAHLTAAQRAKLEGVVPEQVLPCDEDEQRALFVPLPALSPHETYRACVRLLGKPVRSRGSHFLFAGRRGGTFPINFHGKRAVDKNLLRTCLWHWGVRVEEFLDAVH